ncbi:multidrug efflux pump subunit AcrB [Bradyrhizobium japonicum]
MALNISAWSIRNPLPSVVFSIILLILGWTSFAKLAVTRLPSADIPVISVAVSQFGAAPAELESQITKTIEDAVSGVEGVRHITSSITDGLSLTTIQFALETNTDRALNDVKDAVTRVRSNLPQNVTEPLIQRVDVIGLPIVTYAAISPGKTPEQLSYFVDDVVKRALQGVRGVAQVERIGGVEREILVSLDPDRLQAMGLTAVNVSQSLRGTNVDVAGGRAEIGKNDQAIRTLAGAKTLSDLAGTMVPLFGGGEVRLDDLGTVTDTIADRRTFARFNGEPVVALGIKRSKGASDVKVADAVQKRIDALKAAYPDVDLKLIDTSVEYTNGNYEAAISTLFEGAILAVVIVLLFLRDLRATIIAAISLPLSIFPAFWAMDLLGFSLNLVSFLAITLSTGILVDDAIVEIENIVRHMNMGKSPYRAALEAADEIGLAVIAISLTIIAIFAPASFMSGIAGQFFKQFGITVSVQVFFSLLAARFVTPVLAAYFLKHGHHEEPPPGRVLRSYHRIVAWSVKHYFITVLIGFGIFAASIWSITLLPQGFLPAQDSARSLLALELPPGTQLAYTEKGHRGYRRAAAQAARGEEHLRRRRSRPTRHPGSQARRPHHQLYAQGRSRHHPARAGILDQPGAGEHSRHPLLVPRRKRPARDLAGRDRRRRQHRQQRRQRARDADEADPDHLQRDLGNHAGAARAAHRAARRSRRTPRCLHGKPVADHPRRHHRRRRARARQIRRRRPPGADPGAARGRRARQPQDARAVARAAR